MNGDNNDRARLRRGYELLPRILGTGRAKTTLDVLVAHPRLGPDEIHLLKHIQILNWHLAEIPECVEMGVHLHVPEEYLNLRAALDVAGVEYWPNDLLDTADPLTIRQAVVSVDADIVLTDNRPRLKEKIEDGLTVVTDDAAEVLDVVDIYARGFDVPWAWRMPIKDHPWTTFYTMVEEMDAFAILNGYATSLNTASEEAREALRVLTYNTLPNLRYGRDRLLFYQMQRRAAERAGYEHQNFEFESAYHLNHFYLGLYSAIDQLAIMVNAFLNLGLAEREVGATYQQFREPLKQRSQIVYDLFTDTDFTDLSRRVNLLRHQAAHRRPLMPTRIVSEPDHEMSDAELDAKIVDYGWSLPTGLPADVEAWAIQTLRSKARLAAMETIAEEVIVVVDGTTATHIVNPDPKGDVEKFLALALRILDQMPPTTPSSPPAGPKSSQTGQARSARRRRRGRARTT